MTGKVLITGVTGFVGRALAAKLADAGWDVSGLSRDAVQARASVPSLHDCYDWRNIRHAPQIEALRGIDGVVHLAGESVAGLWTPNKRERIEQSRVLGTRGIVEGLSQLSAQGLPLPKVLVSASAMGYYGRDHGDEVLTEDMEPGKDFLATVCARWEAEALKAEELGVRVVRIRSSLVLGDGGSLKAMLPSFRMGLGARLGSGEQKWSWIHLADAVGLFTKALEDRSMSGPFNGVAPGVVTQLEFAKAVAHQLHRPCVLRAPTLVLKTVLGDFSDELLVSRDLGSERLRKTGFEWQFPELSPALADILG